jgi:murein DD-endopeptidase MepM/ murein hydrolase activator NlpD
MSFLSLALRSRGALALAALLVLLTGASSAAAAPHRFLTLPFPDVRSMHIEDGWWRSADGSQHNGIDYIRGAVGKGWTWHGFPVVAAAAGWACAALDDEPGCIKGVGTRVLIRHQLPNGTVLLTYYGHLRKIASAIAVGTDRFSTPVKRGQLLGWAGRTGLPGTGIHLHFELMRKPGDWIDPYDIRGYRQEYPDPAGRNAIACGPDRYWIDNRPAPPASAAASGPRAS